jgi:hypothetical protein
MIPVPRYVDVLEAGKPIHITVEDINKYHGFHLPGGVAHALKVMQRVFPLLAPEGQIERREVSLRTCFRGAGAHDAFEMVTRAVTGGRLTVDMGLQRSERGTTLQMYVFEVTYRGKTVTAVVREGHVRDEFIALGNKPDRTPEEEERMIWMRQEMADRLLALPAAEVYDAEIA